MAAQASLLADLKSIVGADHVREPAEQTKLTAEETRFAVDGLLPGAIVAPGSYDEVANVLRYANESHLAIVPWGGGKRMQIGNVPAKYDIALSLARLNRVIEYEPADLTVVCQAGIEVAELQRVLSKNGQLAPFDGYLPPHSTVGGTLASNTSGASRHLLGSPRDFTIGMRVATVDGRIIKTGGRVVKNVAGYDLCKLFIGSNGSLGVILEAALKIVPAPVETREETFRFPNPDAACDFARELYRRGATVRSFVLTNAEYASAYYKDRESPLPVLSLDFAGTSSAVARSSSEAVSLASQMGAERLDYTYVEVPSFLTGVLHYPLTCTIFVSPKDVPATVRDIEHAAPEPDVAAQPVTGMIRMACGPDDSKWPMESLERVRQIVSGRGGSLLVEYSHDPALKRQIDVFGDLPPKTLDLMRRTKQQFDPNGILSPGRFVGKL